jgi:hypothetical protein
MRNGLLGAHPLGTERFSGSYHPDDCVFLLQPIELPWVDLAQKERLLQSGAAHYSELLSPEHVPSVEYLQAFERAVEASAPAVARDVMRLAELVQRKVSGHACLVSLARAGTPLGVLLRHALREGFSRSADHFSLSLIAGRGIDTVALDHLRARGYADESIVFVDGWTAKGVIGRALGAAVADYNASRNAHLDPTLVTLVDLCGSTHAAASTDDLLLPSSLLGATVSGLVSRTVLTDSIVASGGFHGCRFYAEEASHDRSGWFVDAIRPFFASASSVVPIAPRDLAGEARAAAEALRRWMERLGCSSPSRLKPGIGEATRVLLRRVPEKVVVRDAADVGIAHLLLLAGEKGVPVAVEPTLAWRAVAIITEAA